MSKEKTYNNEKGVLYVVATPIGNLDDVTFRAINTLKNADLIAAEDTRRAKILLSHYGINTPLTSFFSAEQSRKTPHIVDKLLAGENVALISEAGTPGISDPGQYLASFARKAGIKVIPIPGPAAVSAAVSASGMNSYVFTFYGFIPHKGSKRNRAFKFIAEFSHPVVLYESPHRLRRTLNDLLEHLGNRKIFIAREMTKTFEEYIETSLAEAVKYYETTEPRGEFTIIVQDKIEESSPVALY